jgi:hypothetical protein
MLTVELGRADLTARRLLLSIRLAAAARSAAYRAIEAVQAEADPTCEHHRNRAGEVVLVLGMNLRAGEHLLRNLSSYT